MADVTPPASASLPNAVEWRDFLTEHPPGTRASVEGAVATTSGRPEIATPELKLDCPNCLASHCAGVVRAAGALFPAATPGQSRDSILFYSCGKCRADVKSYAVRLLGDESMLMTLATASVAKLGEWPPFSFRTPARVNSLIGPDRDLFFKGRRAESEGLGVGALAYYRRIVEDQKGRLPDEIIRVARRLNAPSDAVARLEAAKAETQFSKAVDMVRDAVPPSLLVKGHNPLKLLRAALSRNLHGASDEECLRVAHAIRVVLFEFAVKLGQAMKDESELNSAVARLLNPEG
jgi:hypothetical protein